MLNQTTELWEKLVQLQHLLPRWHARRQAGPTANAARGQGRILAFLKIQDGIPTKDLAYLLDIRISSLNELLAKLEKNGYIVREPSAEDKRVMLIKLTEKGRAEEQPQADTDSVFGCLTPEEQETFGSYLDRMIAALETELGESDPRGYEETARRRQEAFARWFHGEIHHGHPGRFHGGPTGSCGRRRRTEERPCW